LEEEVWGPYPLKRCWREALLKAKRHEQTEQQLRLQFGVMPS